MVNDLYIDKQYLFSNLGSNDTVEHYVYHGVKQLPLH